jgi:hypothetical protein
VRYQAALRNARVFASVQHGGKARFAPAVDALRRRGRNPTAAAVLREVRTQLGKIDPAQFTRMYQRHDWRTWQDFLSELDETRK